MRLGGYPCYIHDNTLLHDLYQADHTRERHRHRYEFNNLYRREFIDHGMMISGTSPDFSLVEAIEYSDHPFYIGVQYHPEFRSRPNRPHPLFSGLVKASLENAQRKAKLEAKQDVEAVETVEDILNQA